MESSSETRKTITIEIEPDGSMRVVKDGVETEFINLFFGMMHKDGRVSTITPSPVTPHSAYILWAILMREPRLLEFMAGIFMDLFRRDYEKFLEKLRERPGYYL